MFSIRLSLAFLECALSEQDLHDLVAAAQGEVELEGIRAVGAFHLLQEMSKGAVDHGQAVVRGLLDLF